MTKITSQSIYSNVINDSNHKLNTFYMTGNIVYLASTISLLQGMEFYGNIRADNEHKLDCLYISGKVV